MKIHRCLPQLHRLYGDRAVTVLDSLIRLIEDTCAEASDAQVEFSEKDLFMIAYGDSVSCSGKKGIEVLNGFYKRHLKDIFNTLHILPFYPYSSDDGFSVTDYLRVRSDLGGWDDIRRGASHARMMADLVLNHISAKSDWVNAYLAGDPEFSGLALEYDEQFDYGKVIRPRTTELFTDIGDKRLWTTFGPDQVDINYGDSKNLIRMMNVLNVYLKNGIKAVRLDAAGFIWKKSGETCMSLPEAHDIVSIIRAFMEDCRCGAVLVTETNVPHEENVSYFGKNNSEAHIIYNFALPPLILYSYYTRDTGVLRSWAENALSGEKNRAFLNFTASHDGIGLRPLEGLVSEQMAEGLTEASLRFGGSVSYRDSGSVRKAYEINATFVDAVTALAGVEKDDIRPFLGSQAIAMFLPGIPAVYINSLFGIRNWTEGVGSTGRGRTINRYKMSLSEAKMIASGGKKEKSRIYKKYLELLKFRVSSPLFAPDAEASYPLTDPGIFSVIRRIDDIAVLCLVNVSGAPVKISSLRILFPILRLT